MSASLASRFLDAMIPSLQPRKSGEIWEWAEKNLSLSHRVSNYPGPIDFSRTPYMIGEGSPLWAYLRYVDITTIWPTQVGKTLMMQICLAYNASQQPGPQMVVYPDEKSAVKRCKRHITPIFEDSLQELLTGRKDDMAKYEIVLRTCAIVMAWSGSPAALAAEPVKYLFGDEVAKWKGGQKDEADAKSLADRRTGSFGQFARRWNSTTPTTAEKRGWTDLFSGTFHQLHVACHECGKEQVMFFGSIDRRVVFGDDWEPERPGGVRWDTPEGSNIEQQAATAYYECEHCRARWNDSQINDAVQESKWIARYPQRSSYSCHLVSWVAPWVPLRRVVLAWLQAKGNADKRRDFCNSDLAICYVPPVIAKSEDQIRQHILPGLHRGTVPAGTVAVILTADVMEDHLRYRIRAWTRDFQSWGVEEGSLYPSLSTLDALMNRRFQGANGQIFAPLAMVDAGYRTQEVYRFCLRWQGRACPVMGRDNLREAVKLTRQTVTPEPSEGLSHQSECIVVIYQQDQYRDALDNTMTFGGAWHLEEEVSDEYCYQMTGDARVEVKLEDGSVVTKWETVHTNHAFDCEVYQLVARDVFQVSSAPEDTGPDEQHEPIENPYTATNYA